MVRLHGGTDFDEVRRIDTKLCYLTLGLDLGDRKLAALRSELLAKQVALLTSLVVLVLTMRALRATPFFSWFSALVFVPAVILLIVSAVVGSDALLTVSAGFESALYFYAGVSMLAYMLHDEDVTLDEMFAIPAVFTLFAWAFAYLYVVVQGVNPGAWGETRSWMELLFLSFTTLSSTGLSDIVPVTGHARSVIMLEQLAGIFYIAMVVTRLVALRAYRKGPAA